ncbi:hypothetical protein EUTSA_v10017052mg [Eutrema salsugineum]|uniref:WRC domain-containing protein n=1 Tax=Eutrema salsugineum TaxID=72664 RepID=V4MJV9_EUTSA|nr:FK506-binding protein 3 [Eutrema salsugineum]ESQ52923.1 hypothetical protein EUTSA_v10017052mg [Eutrema salsugineum]
MRIRKRQVPLPLSSLLPVPLSDLYFNLSPTATARYFCGEDSDGVFASLQLSPISDRLIPSDATRKKKKKEEEDDKSLDDDDDDDNGDGDADVKSSTDASSSKNVREPESSTQVVEKNEKVVSLRKRRGFRSFEEQEEDEEEEEASGGGGGNKGKRKAKKSGALEEGSRCSRVNGRGWRCCQQTLVGYSLCEHHLGKGRVRSMNKSAGGRGGQGGGGRGGEKKAVVVEVKKKTVKLGMVKARSISSLLGQTSTSSGNADVVVANVSEISAPTDQFAAYDK